MTEKYDKNALAIGFVGFAIFLIIPGFVCMTKVFDKKEKRLFFLF